MKRHVQCLVDEKYSSLHQVLEVDKDASRVRVSLSVPKEPDLSSVIVNKTVCYLAFVESRIAISVWLDGIAFH